MHAPPRSAARCMEPEPRPAGGLSAGWGGLAERAGGALLLLPLLTAGVPKMLAKVLGYGYMWCILLACLQVGWGRLGVRWGDSRGAPCWPACRCVCVWGGGG